MSIGGWLRKIRRAWRRRCITRHRKLSPREVIEVLRKENDALKKLQRILDEANRKR